MKHIKLKDAISRSNSDSCIVNEYPLEENDLDIVVATITGRYPDNGYALNKVSKEIIYVLEGTGIVHFKDKKIKYNAGDVILINKEAYYYETKYSKVTISCSPAWNNKDYENIK